MKRFLSMVLCILMFITMFTATAGQVMAVGNATQLLTVTSGEFKNDTITYKIKLASGITKVTGVVIDVCFDPEALVVEKAEAAGSKNADGDFVQSVAGSYESGLKYDKTDVYSIGYMNLNGVTTSSAKDFFTITFKAKSDVRDKETVTFKCIEFVTNDGKDDNDIRKNNTAQQFFSHEFHALSRPAVKEVTSVGNGLKVVWSDTQGAQNYKLYRKDANASDWTLISDGLTENEYVDNNITKGNVYYYTVEASNDYGATGYDATGRAGMNFGNIESIKAVATATGAKITWSALYGAEKYEVYRKLTVSSKWQLVKTVTACEYKDNSIASGEKYDYKVKAIQGEFSAEMSCAPATVKYIAIPDAEIANVSDGIEIRFDEVGGAEKYIIERKVSDGEFSELTSILASDEIDYYVDEDVKVNVTYSYRIWAVANDNTTSSKNDLGSVIRLGTPSVTEIKNTSTGVSIKWAAVKNATKYVISRKTGNAAVYDKSFETTSTSYVDKNIVSGTKYTYIVSAHNTSGCGASSEPPVSITYVSVPTIKSVAAIKAAIEVKWSAVSGAKSYKVYRATVGSTDWTVVGETSSLSFADDTCKEGVSYKYTVSAVAGGSESAYNTTGVEGMYFGNVTWIKAVTVANGAQITWENLSTADSYAVYRKTADDANWKKLEEVKSAKYTDTNMASGVVYFYMVKAFKGNNISEMLGTPANAKFIATPKSIAKNVNNGIQITVTPVNGAEGYVIEKEVKGKFVVIARLKATEKSYVDTDVVAEKSYTYRVYAISSDVNSGVYEIGSVLRLSCPKITKISNTIPGISITWTPIDDAGAYQVLRKEEGDKKWTVIAKSVTGTTYLDADVFSGEKYTYTINAIMKDGGFSGYSENGKSYKFLETPDLKSVANVAGGVQFKWSAVDGATAYRVYRKTSKSSWKELGDVKGTSFTDKTATSGTKYTYTVKSVNGSCISALDGDGLSIVYMATPTVKISQASNGVKITWNKITGANTYRIYRKVGSGSWTKVADVKSSVTSYTDTKANSYSGKKCAYTVKAYHSSSKTWSSNKSSSTLLVLATPTVTVANSDKGITVKWNKVPGATLYRVYRKTKTGSWTKVKDVGSSTTSYTDTAVNKKSGTLYYYTVKPYNSTNKTWGTTKSSGAIMRLLTPTLKSATSAKSGITLKWSKVTGASGYIVYRKTTGGWSKIATVKGNSKISYLDKSAKKGVTYKYTVKAYYSSSTSYYNTKGIACKDRY